MCHKCFAVSQPLRILTTDAEFYSLTRQLNRFIEELPPSAIQVETVAIAPVATFPERFASRVRQQRERCGSGAGYGFDFIYASQVVYSTQETIVPDVPRFATMVCEALGTLQQQSAVPMAVVATRDDAPRPIFILDAYHAFGAVPTDLGAVYASGVEMIYLSGMLKHVGASANCAFMVIPPSLQGSASMRPLLTGWLADPSVLGTVRASLAITRHSASQLVSHSAIQSVASDFVAAGAGVRRRQVSSCRLATL